ncbi:UEV-domain-containing protein [Peniophora sp. CONT]|nr:UEV-domain-containing protein [Peniophora sp. CONT]
MSLSLTQQWLRQNISFYSAKDRVYADVDALLPRQPTLRPKTDVYTYDDGRTQLLLCIHGLLPIAYRQSSYHIPVAIWLTRDYPREPPIAFVVPTTDMLVKPGKYMDVSGRCTIEYLQNWARKSEGCHLLALVEEMRSHFSRDPPVYSKPKQPQQQQQQDSRPSSLPSSPPTPAQSPPPGAYAYTTAAAPTPAQSVLPALAQPVVPAPNLLDEDEDTASGSTPAPNQTYQAPPRPPNPELLRLHEQVRNKLAGELASLAHAHALDAERLRAHQRDLLAGEPAIRDESARLTAVRDVCGGVAARLRGAVQAAESNVAELRRKGDPPVDELVCAPSIVHNQLIDLVAEDNAIEDTIYHLHRALNAGRIDLDRFLRTTRSLAEEQFMKRALVEKIQTALPASRSGWS